MKIVKEDSRSYNFQGRKKEHKKKENKVVITNYHGNGEIWTAPTLEAQASKV